jgi:hypothetical protein
VRATAKTANISNFFGVVEVLSALNLSRESALDSSCGPGSFPVSDPNA